MPVRIILRQRTNVNLFRVMLLNSIRIPCADEILICSGFFQEIHNGYRISADGNLANELLNSNKRVVLVGIHNGTWNQRFRNFIQTLRALGISVEARRLVGYHWHAKIILLLRNSSPMFGIIGSSNMTRNAFGLSNPFNVEADVVLWREHCVCCGRYVDKTLSENNADDYLNVSYDNNRNNNITVGDRLDTLYEQIMAQGYREY